MDTPNTAPVTQAPQAIPASPGADKSPTTGNGGTSAATSAGPVRQQAQNPASNGGRTLADQVKKPAAPTSDEGPPGETAAERAIRLKMKFKVDGEEIEEELDEHEIRMRLQKSKGAEKRFEEAARLRKEWEDAVALGKRDPAAAMKQLFDVDLEKWAEQRLEERFQEAMLPEHEREKRKLEKELAEYRRQAEEQKTAAEREAKAAYERKVFQETEAQYLEAFQASGLDPQYARTVVMPLAADVALAALKNGIELSPEDTIKAATKRLNQVAQNATKGLKGNALLDFLGDDVVKEVLSARLAKVKRPSAPPAPPKPKEQEPSQERQSPKRRMDPSDFRRKHLFGI